MAPGPDGVEMAAMVDAMVSLLVPSGAGSPLLKRVQKRREVFTKVIITGFPGGRNAFGPGKDRITGCVLHGEMLFDGVAANTKNTGEKIRRQSLYFNEYSIPFMEIAATLSISIILFLSCSSK